MTQETTDPIAAHTQDAKAECAHADKLPCPVERLVVLPSHYNKCQSCPNRRQPAKVDDAAVKELIEALEMTVECLVADNRWEYTRKLAQAALLKARGEK